MTAATTERQEVRGEYLIPEANLASLTGRIAQLQKRARRLHAPEITLTVGARIETPVVKDGRTVGVRVTYPVVVSGPAPRLNGWTFLATLDHASEAGTVLRAVPGVEVPTQYREAGPDCDHCSLARNRHETFVVEHEDGRILQVGRTCLADFLGHVSPESVASLATLLALAREAGEEGSEGGFGASSSRLLVTRTAALAVAAVSQNGWVSAAEARAKEKGSTADDVRHELFHRTCPTHADHKLDVTAAHLTEATEAVEWARAFRDSGRDLSDYEHNLAVVMAGETFDAKNLGLVVSLIAVYRRHQERELRRVHQAKVSEYVGTIGKRETFTVTVLHRQEIGGAYGVSALHKLATPEGSVLAWFATKERLEIGRTYRIKATVKAHREWKGVKETLITRGVSEEVRAT
jgi:hypothetical protein